MMRLVPPNPLARLFKGASSEAQREFQVTVHAQPPAPLTDEELEDATEQALDLLLERAKGTALGPAAACSFVTREVELIFSVEASSVEDLHRRIGQVVRTLEEGGPFRYQDSTTLRMDDDREAVLA